MTTHQKAQTSLKISCVIKMKNILIQFIWVYNFFFFFKSFNEDVSPLINISPPKTTYCIFSIQRLFNKA